ncbi:MAG: CDP-diacylglycerol--glycerol-3-phosphate 3-phosphatidyltransferase [Lachnospiraceae bacterium]|nr:CDP-diacylglycerol--glycerol-3-phosphate 3-phosphatidyltransferase [Lachnospiraceae bacterium]
MNLPNKITLMRVILIPFFIVFMMLPQGWAKWASLAIFVIASLTDFVDGQMARRMNLVTDFGKFMDPLADKMLVAAAMILFVEIGKIPAWVVIVIIAREFIISGFRMMAAEKGVVIAAGWWGKIKTAETMVMLVVLLLFFAMGLEGGAYFWTEQILIYLSLALTVISMIDYLLKNKGVIESC